MKTLAEQIYNSLSAINKCNKDWKQKHSDLLDHIENYYLPSGSGFDSGCTIVREFNENKIEIRFDFHNMKDGYYVGRSKHKVTITPIFGGIDIDVSDEQDYFYDTFYYELNKEFNPTEFWEQNK